MKRAVNKIIRNRLTIPFMPFYRKFPYRGGAAIDSADSRGCVDIEMGFFCNRIPKAANSTVVTNLARMKTRRDIHYKEAKRMFATPADLSSREVMQISSLFKFTVVRNPYTRILSAYLDKVERLALRQNKPSSFRDFLYSLKNGRLYSNGHWVPQAALLLLPIDSFDFIGKVESLDADMAYIEEIITGTFPTEPLRSVPDNFTGANEKTQAYYDPETVELLRRLYRDDFEAFGYPDELPLPSSIISS